MGYRDNWSNASAGVFQSSVFRGLALRAAATAYQQHLRAAGMTGSMSLRGNCWDNACVERLFGTLKRELIHHRLYRTRKEAMQEIFKYLEVFYNRQRRHSTLGYRTPAEFEARAAVAQPGVHEIGGGSDIGSGRLNEFLSKRHTVYCVAFLLPPPGRQSQNKHRGHRAWQ